jgi:hypothetical protein
MGRTLGLNFRFTLALLLAGVNNALLLLVLVPEPGVGGGGIEVRG